MEKLTPAQIKNFQAAFAGLEAEIGKVIIGYKEVIRDTLVCFFAVEIC